MPASPEPDARPIEVPTAGCASQPAGAAREQALPEESWNSNGVEATVHLLHSPSQGARAARVAPLSSQLAGFVSLSDLPDSRCPANSANSSATVRTQSTRRSPGGDAEADVVSASCVLGEDSIAVPTCRYAGTVVGVAAP